MVVSYNCIGSEGVCGQWINGHRIYIEITVLYRTRFELLSISGLDPTKNHGWYLEHFGDPNCKYCKRCSCFKTCSTTGKSGEGSSNNMFGQLNCASHKDSCRQVHWKNIRWLQPNGKWIIVTTEQTTLDNLLET